MNRTAALSRLPWLTISVILHLIVFALLYLFTPLREIVTPDAPDRRIKPAPVSRRQIRQVQQELNEQMEMKILSQVNELQAIEQAIQEIEQTRDRAYREMAGKLSRSAIDVALTEMEKTIILQQEITAQQQRQTQELKTVMTEIEDYLRKKIPTDPRESAP